MVRFLFLAFITFILTGCKNPSIADSENVEKQISAATEYDYLDEKFDACLLASPEETWAYWNAVLSSEDKSSVKTKSNSELIQFHHGWGTGIRNGLCLWKGGPLQKWFLDRDVSHPDTMSMVLINLYWAHLNDCRPNIDLLIRERSNSIHYNCPLNVKF